MSRNQIASGNKHRTMATLNDNRPIIANQKHDNVFLFFHCCTEALNAITLCAPSSEPQSKHLVTMATINEEAKNTTGCKIAVLSKQGQQQGD